MQRVVAYVDGFNLYHGMHRRFRRTYHWLDLEALSRQLIGKNEHLEAARYVTARIRGTRASRLRQVRYLEALGAHCRNLKIVEGRFQQKAITCHSCSGQWLTYEEKESDVNMAIAIVEDAARDLYDTALLVSADSDLCPAIRAARRIRPGTRVIAAFPPRRHSDELRRVADRTLHVDRTMLSRSQMPGQVVTASGVKLVRPAYWH